MKTIGASSTQVRKLNAIASGALATGKPVVVNANGTVSVPDLTAENLGSDVTFSAATSNWSALAFDSTNNKVVVVWSDGDNSNYGSAKVGTVDSSDNSISWGTRVYFISGAAQYLSVCFDSANGKIVIAYQDQDVSNRAAAIVGTVSGTDISFGNPVALTSGETKWINIAYDTSASKVVVAYWTAGTNVGKARVGTVSGTGISFGSEASTVSGIVQGAVVYHAAAARIVTAGNLDNNTANSAVGVISGTNISFGSATAYGTANRMKKNHSLGYDSASEKVIVFYSDEGDSYDGKASVCTVDASNNSISFATAVTVTTDTTDKTNVQGFSTAGKIIFVYSDTTNTRGDLKVGTISGTTLSVGSELNLHSGGNVNYWALCEDTTNDRIVIAYDAAGGNGYGISNVYNPTFSAVALTSENYIGLASNGYPDTAGATIDVKGAISNAVDLNAVNTFTITVANEGSGNRYYIDGTLQATVSLSEGKTYRFDQSDASNSGHPLRLSITSNGTHGGGVEYTTGVTTVGTPGSSGAYTQITVAIGAPTLYYYCSIHSLMGGQANTPDDARLVAGQSYFVQTDGTLNTTADSPSVFAGTAISTTKMIVKG